ncbi:MAG: glycerol-3-phosphate 1-O-acyltransferase PlsY [Chloroflexi bacterium]|nr:glycerol-3-phosphate 1-O-acyltransferase PlsY [Chloroflexota bacterium]MBU1747075.1 glycerol-3-phosphate 1-O-acyltransferase PlsY [Chloroflexota bacterium]
MDWITYVLVAVLAYLVGSIPWGYIVVRVLKGVDVRNYGSGKTGGTNVLRTAGLPAMLLVAVLDIGKGLLAVLAARYLVGTPAAEAVAAVALIAGHNWPVFLGFRGGSGVGTSVSVLLALSPLTLFICFSIWALILALSRYVSLASIVASILTPMIMALLVVYAGQPWEYLAAVFVIMILILLRHRGNMQRLWAGTENQLGQSARKLS